MEYKINFIRNSFIRFYEQHRDEILEAFDTCAKKGDFILREDVSKFEDTLAAYTGTRYGVGVGSGTDALFLSCKALGIGSGDEVITVSHTFIASIQAIVHVGATPVLVDVGTDELIDVSKIEAAITSKTKAIIPVHFHGKVCDMDAIMALAKKYNLYVIEDACQALGSRYKGKMAGSFGDLGCFSFNTPKLLGAYGDAGGVVTDNRELAEKLYLLRNHWNMAQTSVRMVDFPTPPIVHWAYKSRLDNIQAAILNVKFKYYEDFLMNRRLIAGHYCDGLKGLPLKLPEYGVEDVVQEFIIRIGSDEERKRFKEFMDSKGIEILIRETTPNHKVKDLGLDHFDLPVTENISTDAVRLPCYPELYESEVSYIIESIKEFYKGQTA
jgi:dTDP-4-amino-4,6-dideoxygalactose transaminase